jgi:hypothetical protein
MNGKNEVVEADAGKKGTGFRENRDGVYGV